MISLPRDSWVKIPGHGSAKLNAAYAWVGHRCWSRRSSPTRASGSTAILRSASWALSRAVDAVGGIEVCPKEAIKDKDAHLDLPAGCQTLNGKTALGYVRMRKADQTGDVGRMMRQREVIGKVAKKAMNPLTLRQSRLLLEAQHGSRAHLGRGSDTGFGEVLGGVQVFLSSALGSGYSLSVPVSDANASETARA